MTFRLLTSVVKVVSLALIAVTIAVSVLTAVKPAFPSTTVVNEIKSDWVAFVPIAVERAVTSALLALVASAAVIDAVAVLLFVRAAAISAKLSKVDGASFTKFEIWVDK